MVDGYKEMFPLDTGGQMHIWTHSRCDGVHSYSASLKSVKPQHKDGRQACNSTSTWAHTGISWLLEEGESVSFKSVSPDKVLMF